MYARMETKKWLACVPIVFVGDLPRDVFCLSDLWYASIFRLFLVDYHRLFPAQTRTAADQIEHSLRPILVCKDLSDDEYGLFEAS